MRCLYCGKEKALLKRWTSGGEFCSDAHRQQYQDEYDQLALNRLLQAKPASVEKKPAVESKPPVVSDAVESKRPRDVPATPVPHPSREPIGAPRPSTARAFEMPAYPEPGVVNRIEPEPKPVVETKKDENKKDETKKDEVKEDLAPAPAEPVGFLVELPVPAMAEVISMATPETDFVPQAGLTLPSRAFGSRGTDVVVAGRVGFELYSRVLDSAARPTERRLEAREFVHATPVVEMDLYAASGAGLLETSKEHAQNPQRVNSVRRESVTDPLGGARRTLCASKELMEILIFPHPPQGSPPLWQEAEKEFDKIETELGALARVVFETTGLQDNEDGVPRVQQFSHENPATPEPGQVEPVHLASSAIETNTVETNAKTIVPEKLAPAAHPPAAQLVVAAEPPPVARPDPVPDQVTSPLPLMLHGLAAGKGKPVQVFSSAVATGIDVQIPRYGGLPLRPAMTLGPVPSTPVQTAAKFEEKKPAERLVVKTDPKKQQPARPEPRFANSKGRKADVHIPEPETKEPEKKIGETKTAPVRISSIPKEPRPSNPPVAASYLASDLGLPSLSMEASSGFWSKLPVSGKIGMSAALVLIVGGVIDLAMRGTGTAASSVGAHVVEAGPPLPATESGWITDWGVDPGVRRQRQISLLRPSMNLTDYRMEFQGQIDTKAIGWVFRAKDPKNFYVMKLEIVKPGLQPTVALVRFAVINGEELPHTQFPLAIPVRLDTMYKIRFDAVGNHFTTWVQDQKIDEWTDDRIKTGGAGLFSERGERASLRGSLNVVPLVIRR